MNTVNKSLAKIPVIVERASPSRRLHWQRRAFQVSVLALLVLIPLTGLFRIDPIQGAFVVLGRQIWFSDFSIVFGFWVAVACALAMTYSLVGTAFCGWACPQNTLSEWANQMTHKLLGKRADVSLDGTPMQVAPAKNKVVNWIILMGLCVVVAAAIALIPLFYFYSPELIWKFVTFQHDEALAPSLHWIYTIFFLIVFIDVTMIRHFMCRFMCIYKVWQHTFKTRQTLHIAYDETRADECAKCNYCATSCFLGIDPRNTDVYDTCINCGECVTACNVLHARKEKGVGLLRFAVGERQGQNPNQFKTNLGSLFGRVTWSFPIFVLGIGMFIWGLATYERYHIAAYRADTLQGEQVVDYRISIANKFYAPADFSINIEGLPEGSYSLERDHVTTDTAGRINVGLHLSLELPKGLHPFLVRVKTNDGWEDSFRVHHFATGAP